MKTTMLLFAALMAVPMQLAGAQTIIRGNAARGLVSHMQKGEVHLIAEPTLSKRRLVLKVVVLNLSGSPQQFGPDAVTAAFGSTPVSMVDRQALLTELSEPAESSSETAEGRAAAPMPTNGAGQTDVTGFSGAAGGTAGGVPIATLSRTQRRADAADAAKLEAVLLKPITIPANAADGGQVVTEKIKRGHAPEIDVTVAFAGESHHFAVPVPR